MARSFSTEQDSRNASLFVPSIAPTRIGPNRNTTGSAIARGLGSFLPFLDRLAKDEQQRNIGKDIAKARDKLSTIRSPVEFRMAKEKFIQTGLKKYGAKHFALFERAFNLTPASAAFDVSSGQARLTDPLGRTSNLSLKKGTGELARDVILKQAGAFSVIAPNTSKAADHLTRMVNTHRQRIGARPLGTGPEAVTSTRIQNSMLDALTSIRRTNELFSAQGNDPVSAGVLNDPKLKADVGSQIMGKIISGFMSLTDPNLVQMLRDPKTNALGPTHIMSVVDGYISDVNAALRANGAANRLGVDMTRFFTLAQSVRKEFLAMATNNFKGKLLRAELNSRRLALHVQNMKNASFANVFGNNPALLNLHTSATALQAAGNLVFLQSKVESLASKDPSGTGTERLNFAVRGFIESIATAPALVQQLNSIKKLPISNRESLFIMKNTVMSILRMQNGQALLHFDRARDLMENKILPSLDGLVKNKNIKKPEADAIREQWKDFLKRRKQAIASSGLTEKEVNDSIGFWQRRIKNFNTLGEALAPSIPKGRPSKPGEQDIPVGP